MSSVVPYTPSNPIARAIERSDQRSFAREIVAVKRPARIAEERFEANARATARGMQAVAAVSQLEAQLSTDEVVARRLAPVVNAFTAGVVFEVQMLGLGGR